MKRRRAVALDNISIISEILGINEAGLRYYREEDSRGRVGKESCYIILNFGSCFISLEPPSFDDPAETDVLRISPTSTKSFCPSKPGIEPEIGFFYNFIQ